MGIYRVKPRFQQSLRGVEVYLVARRVHPDYLTLAALLLCIAGGAALVASRQVSWLMVVIVPVALGRTALNALDGLVARDTGLARPWGEVLNEFCDRLADVALFMGVAFAPGGQPMLGAVTIVMMLLSSYVAILSKTAGGRRQYGGMMGKADRMIYLSIAAVVAFLVPGLPIFTYFLILVLVGLNVTLVQRLRATYADLRPQSH